MRGCWWWLLMWSSVMVVWLEVVESTLFVPDGDTFDSKPAQFGKPLEPNKTYQARLQFLNADPHLCGGHVDPDANVDDNDDDDVRPPWRGVFSEGDLDVDDDNDDDDSGVIVPTDGIPVAILAKRGSCSFARKAMEATLSNPAVHYLIVYDDKPHQALVPMSSNTDTGDVDVAALFVSLDTGRDLLRLLNVQSMETAQKGGLVVRLNADAPWTPSPSSRRSNSRVREEWMIATMATFFMLLSCMGTVLLCAHAGYLHTDGNVIFIGRRVAPSDDGGLPPGQQQRRRRPRRVLNREQVADLTEMEYPPSSTTLEEGALSSMAEEPLLNEDEDDEEAATTPRRRPGPLTGITTCSVCLEEFATGDSILLLHCQHFFHTDCIVPWLTRRSSSCPLCKADMLPPSEEAQEEAAVPPQEAENGGGGGEARLADLMAESPVHHWMTTLRSWLQNEEALPQQEMATTTTTLETPLLSDGGTGSNNNSNNGQRRELHFEGDATTTNGADSARRGGGGGLWRWWNGGDAAAAAAAATSLREETPGTTTTTATAAAAAAEGDVELLIQQQQQQQQQDDSVV